MEIGIDTRMTVVACTHRIPDYHRKMAHEHISSPISSKWSNILFKCLTQSGAGIQFIPKYKSKTYNKQIFCSEFNHFLLNRWLWPTSITSNKCSMDIDFFRILLNEIRNYCAVGILFLFCYHVWNHQKKFYACFNRNAEMYQNMDEIKRSKRDEESTTISYARFNSLPDTVWMQRLIFQIMINIYII